MVSNSGILLVGKKEKIKCIFWKDSPKFRCGWLCMSILIYMDLLNLLVTYIFSWSSRFCHWKWKSQNFSTSRHVLSILSLDYIIVVGILIFCHPFQYPPELQSVHNVLQSSQHFLRGDAHHLIKRGSRASDTSSAYSGSDMMQSSLGDDENTDLSGLVETMVDSDDEEGYVESPDVSILYNLDIVFFFNWSQSPSWSIWIVVKQLPWLKSILAYQFSKVFNSSLPIFLLIRNVRSPVFTTISFYGHFWSGWRPNDSDPVIQGYFPWGNAPTKLHLITSKFNKGFRTPILYTWVSSSLYHSMTINGYVRSKLF